ncbi:zinc knuckle CX2CX4HX4C containing protein [Tanacetum coccineum]
MVTVLGNERKGLFNQQNECRDSFVLIDHEPEDYKDPSVRLIDANEYLSDLVPLLAKEHVSNTLGYELLISVELRGAMAGVDINTLTMEQYLALSRENQAPGVVKPEIEGNVNFEIKSQFMRELREETFSGNKNEDAHDHVDRVLNIVSLFNIPRVSQDAILLCVFPFTLTGTAKRWVDRLTLGAVNTWDLLKKAFIQRQLLDSQGLILGMTPTQALTVIQTMADHSQKWHDETLSRSISSSSNTDGLAAIVSKLDNLGCDIKNLKENVHGIQVGFRICEGPYLDKECPLKKEVKQVEEAKYREFGRLAPFNGSNGAKYSVGPPRYYTRTNNRPPYGEKRPSLEELMNKHLEESARRSTEMNEWIKKLQESAEVNMRNQSTSLKNLETQIKQLTKELHSRATNEIPSSSTGRCKMVNTDHETPRASINVMPKGIFDFLKLTNLRKTNMLIEMVDMTKKALLGVVENVLVGIDKFLFPFDFVIIDRTPNETVILGRPFLTIVRAKIYFCDRKITLEVDNDRIIFDMDHNFMIPTERILMMNLVSNKGPSHTPGNPSSKQLKTDN